MRPAESPVRATSSPQRTLGPPVKWTQKDGRIAATVVVVPGNPRVGDLVSADITAAFKSGSETSGETGDALNYSLTVEGIDAESNGMAHCSRLRTASQMKSFERRWVYSGTYEEPGSYDVVVILSPRCTDDEKSQVVLRRTLVVEPA